MTAIPELEARYSANIIQFDREIRRMQSINARAANKILADHKASAAKVNQTWGNANIGQSLRRSIGGGLAGLKGDLAGLSGMLAASLSVGAAIGLADTYTEFAGALKTAGLEGANFAAVQDHLFETANRNGVAISSLGGLYRNLSIAATQLGASQGTVLELVDSITAAVRSSAAPTAAAEGALTQFGQALINGKVQAEEWASIRDALPTAVQAMANASSRFKGDIGALNMAIKAGTVTSQELLQMMVASRTELEGRAAAAPLTVGKSFEVLKNKMVEAIGATDATWGITARLTEAIVWLSENLDTVASSLGVVALVLSATMAPAVGRTAIALATMTAATTVSGVRMLAQVPAMLAFSASLQGITVGAAAARTGLQLLTSATGIGLIVTALTAVVGFFAVKSYKAAEATRQFRAELQTASDALQAKKAAATEARQATGQFTADELKAITATANLTGRVDLLASAYGRMALQAWEAARAAAAASLADANHKRRVAQVDRETTESRTTRRAQGPGYYGTADGRQAPPPGLDRVVRGAVAADPAVVAARNAEQQAIDLQAAARAEVERVAADARRAGGVESYYTAPTTTSAGGKTGGGGGSSGPTAADRAKNADDALYAAQAELAQATRAMAVTVDERHTAALAQLDADRADATREIARRVTDNEIDAATGVRLNAIEDQITAAHKDVENARHQEEVQARNRYLADQERNATLSRITLEEDAANYLAQTATTMDERHRHEREALSARERADDLSFAASQETLRLELVKQSATQAEIDLILARNQAARDASKAQARGQLSSTQDRENGPNNLREWATGFAEATAQGQTFNQQLMGIAQGGINDLSDGITDAIMGAKSFGEAISDMAKSVIASLIKMAVQFLIFEALGRAFGVPGLGRAAIGLTTPNVGKNAAGTNNWRGGLTSVNEKGPEIMNLPNGTQIIPHRLAKDAFKEAPGGRKSAPIVINTTVNANGAFIEPTIKGWIAQSNIEALQMGAKVQDRQQRQKARQRLGH